MDARRDIENPGRSASALCTRVPRPRDGATRSSASSSLTSRSSTSRRTRRRSRRRGDGAARDADLPAAARSPRTRPCTARSACAPATSPSGCTMDDDWSTSCSPGARAEQARRTRSASPARSTGGSQGWSRAGRGCAGAGAGDHLGTPGAVERAGRAGAGARLPVAAAVAPPDPRRLLLILGALSALGPASMDDLPAGAARRGRRLRNDAGGAAERRGVLRRARRRAARRGPGQRHVRRAAPPMLIAIVLFALASIACAAAPSIGVLSAHASCRGRPPRRASPSPRRSATCTTARSARGCLALVLTHGRRAGCAPATAALVLQVTSWRGVFGVLVGLSALLLLATARTLPETCRRSARNPGSVSAMRRRFGVLLRHRVFVGYALTLAFSSGALDRLRRRLAVPVPETYGVSAQVFGLIFGANAVAMIAASQLERAPRHAHPARAAARGRGRRDDRRGDRVRGRRAGRPRDLGGRALPARAPARGASPPNAIALAMRDHPEIAGTASALAGRSRGIGSRGRRSPARRDAGAADGPHDAGERTALGGRGARRGPRVSARHGNLEHQHRRETPRRRPPAARRRGPRRRRETRAPRWPAARPWPGSTTSSARPAGAPRRTGRSRPRSRPRRGPASQRQPAARQVGRPELAERREPAIERTAAPVHTARRARAAERAPQPSLTRM